MFERWPVEKQRHDGAVIFFEAACLPERRDGNGGDGPDGELGWHGEVLVLFSENAVTISEFKYDSQ